jgi:hypothetical protein
MYCRTCGNQINDNAIICVNCDCSVSDKKTVEDVVNVGLCVLAVFVPLFGIIYWAIKYKETPKAARAVGITAVISIAANIIIGIIYFIAFFSVLFSAIPRIGVL